MVGFFEFSVWFRHDFTGFRRSDWVVEGGSVPRPKRTWNRRVRKNSRQSGGWEVIFDLSFAQQIAYYFL
jgi:hypothetical protein